MIPGSRCCLCAVVARDQVLANPSVSDHCDFNAVGLLGTVNGLAPCHARDIHAVPQLSYSLATEAMNSAERMGSNATSLSKSAALMNAVTSPGWSRNKE